MVTSSWVGSAAGAAGLLFSAEGALANLQRLNQQHDSRAAPQDSVVPSLLARAGTVDTTRTGNWTQINCRNDFSQHPYNHTAHEQWSGLGADDAWYDAVRVWNTSKHTTDYNAFTNSVMDTLSIGYGDCARLTATLCDKGGLECSDLVGVEAHLTGAAAPLIWNSLSAVADMCTGHSETLRQAVVDFNHTALYVMEKIFAPVPGDTANGTWAPLLDELVNLGPLAVLGPYVVRTLELLPWFSDKSADAVKNTTMILLRASVAVAKTAPSTDKPGEYEWKGPGGTLYGSNFPRFMSRAVDSWQSIFGFSTYARQFNGSYPESIAALGEAMADGRLVEQAKWPVQLPSVPARITLTAPLAKTFFGFVMPALWRRSSTYAFVLDSGAACDADQQTALGKYLDAATINATGACVDGKRYYLVHPAGSASSAKFSAPPGLDHLPFYNNITVEDLVQGALRTWIPGGGNGTGAFVDPTTNTTAAYGFLDGQLPGPGVVRLPVCSPDQAMRGWKAGTGANATAFYPCDGPTSAGGRVRYPGAAAVAVVLGLALFNIM